MKRIVVVAVAAFALLLGVVATPAQPGDRAPAQGATYDFGDAPDGAATGYAGRPVTGRFPSRAANGGPRHSNNGPRLGGGWTAEADSRQPDRDGDDGASLVPRPCALSQLTVIVDASRVNPGAAVYLNAWFDWNRDGDWADGAAGSCGPEWGVQNARVDPTALGNRRVAAVVVRFRAGRVPAQFWWRVQVHAGSPAPHAGGGGQPGPTPGETEDYFYGQRAPRAKKVWLTCAPASGVLDHGRSLDLVGQLGGSGFGVRQFYSIAGGDLAGTTRKPTWVNRRLRVTVQSTRKHARDPLVQVVSIQFIAVVRVSAPFSPTLERTLTARCRVGIWHSPRYEPPPVEQDQVGPVQPPFSLGPAPVIAVGTFTNGRGGCPFATSFRDSFQFFAPGDGTLTITQPRTGDRVSGTINPDGSFSLRSATETYVGRITGNTVTATYTYTRNGCTETYDVTFVLQR